MHVFKVGTEVIQEFNGELVKGVIEDVHHTCGIFIHYEKPVPCKIGNDYGFMLDRAWHNLSCAEYQEVESLMSTQPTKQFVVATS